jgi:DNA-binding CsgD family transcriptional regulator
MNTEQTPSSPVAGLLSLMADAMDTTSPAAPRTDTEVPGTALPDVTAILSRVVHGWMSVKDDGHGWMLLQFAPGAEEAPRPADTDRAETGAPLTVVPEPGVTPHHLEGFGGRAHRVTYLTDREREVLCLVATGATNCAIARRLFISPKTASVHVSRILTKLDASTRTEAAAIAHAAGLVQLWGHAPAQEPRPSVGPSLVHA